MNARFGRPLPAVGFAMSLKLALIALERQGVVFENPVTDCEIGFDASRMSDAINLAQEMRKQGRRVSLAYDMTEDELKNRQGRGICREWIYLSASGEVQTHE